MTSSAEIVPSISLSRTKMLAVGIPVVVAVCTAWYLYYSCRRSDLCLVNTPLYVILTIVSYVLPENPLDRNITSFREQVRTSKPVCDLSLYTVGNEMVRPGEVPIRIYQPQQRSNNSNALLRPVVIWFHGGGWVVGDYVEDLACTKISEVHLHP